MRDDLVVPGEHEEDFVWQGMPKLLPFPFRLWNYVCLKKNRTLWKGLPN